MLINFTIGNFLSFKQKSTISFVASPIREFQDSNLIETPITNLNLLKGAAVYGANSSGKSNLFKALAFMKEFVLGSSKDRQANEEIDVEHFRLSTETENQPSFFEIEFIFDDIKYRYGFEVSLKNVVREWLYYAKKAKEFFLFSREGSNFNLDDKFEEGRGLEAKTRENALFVSVAAQFNGQISINIVAWFQTLIFISGARDGLYHGYTTRLFSDPVYKKIILNFLKRANLGFEDIDVEKRKITDEMLSEANVPDQIKELILSSSDSGTFVKTEHSKFDATGKKVGTVYFSLDFSESLGTQKYYALAGPIIEALKDGHVLVVDELDARLHPHLSYAITQLFNSRGSNPNSAQLLFATHNSNLLNRNVLRRDQIIFTKKNRFGETTMSTLLDEKVRNDASFEKDYLSGKYGAIPTLPSNSQLSLFD